MPSTAAIRIALAWVAIGIAAASAPADPPTPPVTPPATPAAPSPPAPPLAPTTPAEGAAPYKTVRMEQVVVSATATDASTAMADKAASETGQDVVSGAALKQPSVQDAADALKGVSGVSVTRAADGSNNVTIRGLAPQFNRVSVDGQRQSNSSKFTTGTSLDSLPPEILKSIEVSKSLTPDMDGDAIGGVINLSTANPSDLKKPFTEGREQVVIDSLAVRPGTRTSIDVGRPFQLLADKPGDKPDAGILATFTYDKTYKEHESVETFDDWPLIVSPGPAPFTGTPVPAFTRTNLEQTLDRRERGSLLFNADLRIGPSVFSFKSNYTRDDRRRYRTQEDFDTGSGTPLDLTPTAGTFSGVQLQPRGEWQEASRELTTVLLGDKTDIGRIHASASAGLTRTLDYEPGTIDTMFGSADSFTVSYSTLPNPVYPSLSWVDGNNPAGTAAAAANPAQYDFGQLIITHSRAVDTNLTEQADLKLDLDDRPRPSYLKFGVKVQEFQRSVDESRTIYIQNPAAPTVTMAGLVGVPVVTLHDGGYQYGPMPDAQKVANLVAEQPGMFELDAMDTALASTSANYAASQTIWAAYGMAKGAWGPFSLIAGVRVEGTQFDASADQPIFDPTGALTGFAPASDGGSYVDVLPGLHLRYEPEPGAIFRASAYRSLIRPSYGDLAPYLDLNFEEFRARIGNPNLKPYSATNYDVSADRYLESMGLFSASLFFKSIRNFQADSERVAAIGDLGQFLIYQKINGDTADVAGAEASWKSNPWTLPDGLTQGSFAVTDTFTQSSSHLPTRPGETLPLPLQARNQFSLTLHGERGRLSIDANITYHTTMLYEIVSYDRDRYIAGNWNEDLGTAYKLTRQLTLQAGVGGLGSQVSRAYSGQPSMVKETERFGYQITAGVNWKI